MVSGRGKIRRNAGRSMCPRFGDVLSNSVGTVSYTHLDVYKRQSVGFVKKAKRCSFQDLAKRAE